VGWIVGVDVGGTFTDFFAVEEESGSFRLWKRPSTPENPADAIVRGLSELAATHGVPLDRVGRLCHGTTVATNALIQRRGQPVALLTTRGFRDLVEIGRQTRPHLYDLQQDSPEPLAPRERRFEVRERVMADGSVRTPLDDADLDAAVADIERSGADAIAVCFLFSFLNPAHEQAAAAAIRKRLPRAQVSLSSEVQPEFREYERFTTTIINAYLQPALDAYMGMLESRIGAVLPRAVVGINQSSGGLMSMERARLFPVRTALSGPAAGAIGAVHVARTAGRPNAITIDVGGTSADVALIRDYRVDIAYGREVDGFPIRLPMVDISTIGAGGGSIAWFDRDGLLKVGPRSAGAVPGPACYGRGGTEATVSDANLVLGRLSTRLVGGGMALDAGLARAAVAGLAGRMGKTVEATAHGILGIAVANMVRVIRGLSVERGHDPRGFALMPFGGAGPLHARDIAVALGMREILVPPAPGILCAQGLVVSDLKEDFVVSGRVACDDAAGAAVRERLGTLMGAAESWCAAEGIAPAARAAEFTLDMRYVGQNFELGVEVARGQTIAGDAVPSPERLRALFYAAHERAYGFHDPDAPVEIVNLRLTVRAPMSVVRPPGAEPTRVISAPSPVERRPVYFDGEQPVDTPVYQRADLQAGQVLAGPAVIEQFDATLPLFPGDRAVVDAAGNILIEVAHGRV